MKNLEHQPSTGNKLRRTIVAVGLCLSAVALSACGEAYTPPEPNPKQTEKIENPSTQNTYYEDGTRITTFSDSEDYAPLLSYCDGPDLLDQTAFMQGYKKGAGNSIERTPSHPACADGKLTPDDFRIPG